MTDASTSMGTSELTTDVTGACGNGMLGSGEQCDSNDVAGDNCEPGCSATSSSGSCGDGQLDPEEECDDGNDESTDACVASCMNAICGDGYVQDGVEVCDDGTNNGMGYGFCAAGCQDLGPRCGDMIKNGMEECDDGNTDENDACAACQNAACGDGFVWVGEETCDDGNDVDTDDCTNACEPADCGDGIVREGVEECDDGNLVDTDACSNKCLKPRRVIFVTSTKFEGDLMGLSGADVKCGAAAAAVETLKEKNFKAWLSTGSNWPAKRLDTAYLGMYVLTDGTVVAENGWADLTDSELLHPIDLTETKMKVNGAPWTNTKADGTPVGGNHCNFWTEKEMPRMVGSFGLTNATDGRWTDAMNASSCSGTFPLYCIENP